MSKRMARNSGVFLKISAQELHDPRPGVDAHDLLGGCQSQLEASFEQRAVSDNVGYFTSQDFQATRASFDQRGVRDNVRRLTSQVFQATIASFDQRGVVDNIMRFTSQDSEQRARALINEV